MQIKYWMKCRMFSASVSSLLLQSVLESFLIICSYFNRHLFKYFWSVSKCIGKWECSGSWSVQECRCKDQLVQCTRSICLSLVHFFDEHLFKKTVNIQNETNKAFAFFFSLTKNAKYKQRSKLKIQIPYFPKSWHMVSYKQTTW